MNQFKALGLTMIVLPGPAIILISVGLEILATEFVWGRSLLEKVSLTSKKGDNSNDNETK